jgi:hypothetical protein
LTREALTREAIDPRAIALAAGTGDCCIYKANLPIHAAFVKSDPVGVCRRLRRLAGGADPR